LKIIFLSKRRPMGRDLLTRPYGRFFYLPKILAERGHQVTLVTLSYAMDKTLHLDLQGIDAWSIPAIPFGPIPYLRKVQQLAEEIRPDWIFGLSDTYYGIGAEYIARQSGARSAIDAYDNYESYIPWFGSLHRLWREALRRADLVTAAGPQLAELMGRERKQPPIILPMAADPCGFMPLDRQECRRRLGLHLNRPIIGYCGSLSKNRGIETLFGAYEQLKKYYPDAILIVSGRREKKLKLPVGTIYLGYLPDEQVPWVLNAVDVLTVVNKDSIFGRYSYPVKLYEAMQCAVPVVASDTGPIRWIIGNQSEHLAIIGAVDDMAVKLQKAIQKGFINYSHLSTWEASARSLEKSLMGFDSNNLEFY
jgi:glycosyltransferase involved in cell wall biosynthesis